MLIVRSQHHISAIGYGINRFKPIRDILFLSILLCSVMSGGRPALGELDLADTPLLALVKSPPANIMILLDDSGSMTSEILVKGEYEGRYPNPADSGGQDGYCYIFDHLGDNAYPETERYLLTEGRKFWRSQHFKDNVMYYNPNVTYEPWTSYGDQTFLPADKENPKPHPTKTGVTPLDLDAESFTIKLRIDETTEADLKVKHAHYFFQMGGEDLYLVVIDGEISNFRYFKIIETEGSGFAQKVIKAEEVSAATLPDGIASLRSYDAERQNFANWFTYHRRREYAAKAAMAEVIENLERVRVGLLSINGQIIVPLKPVDAKMAGVKQNERNTLFQALYAYDSMGDTPLREGLNDVGKYYMSNSKDLTHFEKGSIVGDRPPFFKEAEGGVCQKCFTIVMTDGYYSYPDTDYNGVGNTDGSTTKTVFDRNALTDSLADTLADVAMYYYKNDLSTDAEDDPPGDGLADDVATNEIDEATHQHMVTYGVTFGVDGDLDRTTYDLSKIYTDDTYTVPWPTKINEREPQTIDDLWHATLNSRGDCFTVGEPQALVASLLALSENVSQQLTGSAASVSINGNQLYGEKGKDTLMFRCLYSNENKDWIGDVLAYGFDEDSGALDTHTPVWSAAEQLQIKNWADRNIATYDPAANTGIVFDYDNLTDAQKGHLGSDGIADSEADLEAQNRVSFLKGKEIIGFRSRSQKLGDIVHSAPVYENEVVYVGGNDGMLHAFNTRKFEPKQSEDPDLGEELFAYVPALVFENLAALTSPEYDHKFFVDLTPTVKKGAGLMEGRPPTTAMEVQTILVGGLGKGGKGYYALDITDPFSINTAEKVAQNVLWEFSVNNDADMGFSYSKPVVVQSRDTQKNPWIVIFGNGYGSQNGNAVLFILNPAKTPDDGLLVKKFNLGGGPDNGLSSPTAVDVDFDGKVDYVYVGDLTGNLWKIDLTGDTAADWDVAFYEGTDMKPLFQAKGPKTTDFPQGSPQPITSKPEVTFHPSKHGLLVMFGTGKFLGNDDFTDNYVQSVYGIWDYGDDDDDAEYLGAVIRGTDGAVAGLDNLPEMEKTNLLKQKIQDFWYPFPNGNVVNVRVMTQNIPNWVTENDTNDHNPNPSTIEDNHVGWYFDLSERERVDTDVLLNEGKLIVISFIPDANRCKPNSGSAYFMEIDAISGGNIVEVQFDANGGGTLGDDDLVEYYDVTDKLIKIPPGGLLFRGKLQTPAILTLDKAFGKIGEGDINQMNLIELGCGEEKYMSTSSGEIRTVCEKAVTLGISSWKEVEQ